MPVFPENPLVGHGLQAWTSRTTKETFAAPDGFPYMASNISYEWMCVLESVTKTFMPNLRTVI